MEIKLYLALFLLAAPVAFSEQNYDYCNIPSCDPGTHVFCIYKSRTVDLEACGEVSSSQISQDERDMILDLHNEFRREVYNGRQRHGENGAQPAAVKPQYLEWDYELEDAAHRWSIQCQSGEDECRNLPGVTVNQLVGGESLRIDIGGFQDLSVETIVRNWYYEVGKVGRRHLQSFDMDQATEAKIQHYTQMLWGNTRKIGCNTIKHTSRGYKRVKLVCNYGPAGNVDGEPVYEF